MSGGQLTRRELELVDGLVDEGPVEAVDRGAVSRALSWGLACDVEHQAREIKAQLRAGDVDGARDRLAVLLEATRALHAELSGIAVIRALPSQWSVECRRCHERTQLVPGLGPCSRCGSALWTVGPTSGPRRVSLPRSS